MRTPSTANGLSLGFAHWRNTLSRSLTYRLRNMGHLFLSFPLYGTSEEQRAEIDVIAAHINAEPCEIVNGHYGVSRFFGPIEYRAVAIDPTANGLDGE